MKVTYLYHSGVCVETDKQVLLFDYYKGEIPKFDAEKTIYVFASHRHPDHFTSKIFELSKRYARIYFILSHDIKRRDFCKTKGESLGAEALSIVSMAAQQEEIIGDIQVKTLKSTDTGVAFLVKIEGETVYHAGDLNWWHWSGETRACNRNMEVNYKREIDSIKKEQVKVAFVPLDTRLGDACDKGIRYFMETVDCDFIVPIHMWDEYEAIGKLKEILPAHFQKKLIEILHTNQEIMI